MKFTTFMARIFARDLLTSDVPPPNLRQPTSPTVTFNITTIVKSDTYATLLILLIII
jgi:hypothetical protein